MEICGSYVGLFGQFLFFIRMKVYEDKDFFVSYLDQYFVYSKDLVNIDWVNKRKVERKLYD